MKNNLAMVLLVISAAAHAQSENALTYKCVTEAKVTYTDEPCVGAQVVHATPTKRLDKISVTNKKRADFTRPEYNKVMADASMPLPGQTRSEQAKASKRAYLSPQDKLECYMLYGQILDERTQEAALYQARKQFKAMRC